MQKICSISGEPFEVTESDLAFYDAVSPMFAGQKFQIPPPSRSPDERQRRRLAFRNLRSLHHRTCDASGMKILSCFPPDSELTVYYADEWWSDSWDGLDFGVDFDFGRPFFEQFRALRNDVPIWHLWVTHNENCEYVNGVANCRNCYLCFNIDHSEDCFYLSNSAYVVSSVDCLSLKRCELCYECIDCVGCYNASFLFRCSGCSDSSFLSHCRNCSNCIGCSNLTGKEYYVFNRKVTKDEYQRVKEQLSVRDAMKALSERARMHHLQYPVKCYFGHSNESFSGDTVEHIKNSYHCIDCFELENCSYCNYVFNAANCMDYSIFGDHSQWIYECLAVGMNCSNNLFCAGVWAGSSNNIYCQLVTSCSDCFGCTGLRKKQYCVFNKQYSKEEYEALVARIITHMQHTGEWGEFFPAADSPHALNETVAQEYSPLSREEALRRGYRWDDTLGSAAAGSKKTRTVPNSTAALQGEDVGKPFFCASCEKQFKIISQELQFYRRAGLPSPDCCPECRHRNRLVRRPSYRLWPRNCADCGVEIATSYSPSRPERVCCEQCFLASVD